MKTKYCPNCKREFRKGRRAWYHQEKRGLRRGIVCQHCAESGVTIIPNTAGELAKCTVCEKRPATLCTLCAVLGAAAHTKKEHQSTRTNDSLPCHQA